MAPDSENGPRRGRPVDPGVEIALRAAALSVLAEYGWRGTTVERIAEQSGVARTTIYRRYGSVHGIMLMLLEHVWTLTPTADTGSLRGDLVDTARGAQALWSDPEQLDYLCAMTAASRENDEVAQALHVRDEEWQVALRPIAERATARGELQPGADGSLLVDLVCSAVLRRALSTGTAPPADFPEHVVDAVLAGFAH